MDGNPPFIWIEPTTRCNARCVHCDHGYRAFGQDMDGATFDAIRAAVLDDVRHVELTGYGEPLLCPLFDRLLEECVARGVAVTTTSNGILLRDDDRIARLIESGSRLVLSIDGARAETHEFVRPQVKWSRLLETLGKIRDAARRQLQSRSARPRFSLAFNFVAMKQNIADLPDLVRLAADYGADTICVLPLSQSERRGGIQGQDLQDCPELVSASYLRALKLAGRLGVRLTVPPFFRELIAAGPERGRGARGKVMRLVRKGALAASALRRKGVGWTLERLLAGLRPRSMAGSGFCAMPWTSAYFAANGAVHPCCAIGTEMGRLSAAPWDEIWNGAMYRNLRRTIHSWNPTEMCRNCAITFGINGGDERQYATFFSRFRGEPIPLNSTALEFADGFHELEFGETGQLHHRWMGREGRLALTLQDKARFLRLRIAPRAPTGELNFGVAIIGGRHREPFDTSCADVILPLDGVRPGRVEIRLEMERVFRAGADPRPLALAICGVERLW